MKINHPSRPLHRGISRTIGTQDQSSELPGYRRWRVGWLPRHVLQRLEAITGRGISIGLGSPRDPDSGHCQRERQVRTVPAQLVEVPFGRGAPMGRTRDGVLYAGFSTEGPGLESILLASGDEGRTWRQKRLDWWQFFDQALARDSWPWLFFDNRWALRSDSFGVLRDGTLLWAFRHGSRWLRGRGTRSGVLCDSKPRRRPELAGTVQGRQGALSFDRKLLEPNDRIAGRNRALAPAPRRDFNPPERGQASGGKVFAALDGDLPTPLPTFFGPPTAAEVGVSEPHYRTGLPKRLSCGCTPGG